MTAMTRAELEAGRRNLLAQRQAVLTKGGQGSQEQASRLWADAMVIEVALRWGR